MFTLYMLISYTISDFIIQTSGMIEAKVDIKHKRYILHAITLLLTMIPFLLVIKYSSYTIIFRIVAVVLLYIIIDFIKEITRKAIKHKEYYHVGKAILFIVNQLFHIFIIIAVTRRVDVQYNGINEWLVNNLLNGNGLTYVTIKKIFIMIYVAFAGAYFIPLIFDIVYRKIDKYSIILQEILLIDLIKGFHDDLTEDFINNAKKFVDEVKIGKWIGILERTLIIIFLYSNQISLIGFVIAVKALARFKMMENKIFSEYYLLGTFFSIVYTFITYTFFQYIL